MLLEGEVGRERGEGRRMDLRSRNRSRRPKRRRTYLGRGLGSPQVEGRENERTGCHEEEWDVAEHRPVHLRRSFALDPRSLTSDDVGGDKGDKGHQS